MFNNTEFDSFKRITLKRLRPILKPLDIENDFLELSTSYMGKSYEVRIMGTQDLNGNYFWEIVRVVNRSIIPSTAVQNVLESEQRRN